MSYRKLTRAVVAVCIFAIAAALTWAAPFADRAAFVASNPKSERVPVEAFAFNEHAKGLKIEVWATSPQLFTPVTMDIDPKGRAWVVEGVDYGRGRTLGDGTSIVVISDTDGDGKADESHVFVAEPNVRTAPLGIGVFDNVIVLSATPDIIVYTDVDRDGKFDPKIDKREVFLTGFQGGGHDHTLHAVVGSPSGQWYFSYGNKGANIKTVDGRHFVSNCYYGNPAQCGIDSSDGHRYIGGAAMRINPDGTGLNVVGHNFRNTHDMVVNSFGDVYQNDNDDPSHCRATWLMEYGNLGYSDLIDGTKSWEEIAKSWEEQRPTDNDPPGYVAVHGKGVIRSSASHWRENYPGTIPPGDVYGAGSPTGVTFIEGDELGAEFRGTYLACDMVHKALLGYKPALKDAEIQMVRLGEWLGLNEQSKGQFFLPTDIVVGTDGALYLADFYNDTSRHVDQVSGTIYRITRTDGKPMTRPTYDFDTTAGLFAALASPNSGVRFVAVSKLMAKGAQVEKDAEAFFTSHADNPYIAARAVWLLAKAGDAGRTFVENLLKNGDESQRIVAYRALRFALPDRLLAYAAQVAGDKSASVRREVALSMRDVPFAQCKDILATLIANYEPHNRWYLEALGTAASLKETQVYDELVKPLAQSMDYAKWDDKLKNLAWRLHTPAAVDDLDKVIRAQLPDITEFRHLIMAYALYTDEPDRAHREKIVLAFADIPQFKGDDYQTTVSEVYQKDIRLIPPVRLTQDYLMPRELGPETKVSTPEEIAKLPGDAAHGKARATLCLMCHRIDGVGPMFAPDLSTWGTQRTIAEIAKDIVAPSDKLAHGFEDPVRITGHGKTAEGFLVNYSYHAGSCKIKVMGGDYLKLLFRGEGLRIEHLKESWMPPASKMGLTDQDVRDIAEYLHTK